MESWINEKLQIAAEASYREASNLQVKLQKHETFEAEITANKGQLDNILKQGDSLLKTFPAHRETVEKRRKDLIDLWKLLKDLSANKALRLKEAIQKQTFDRNVTELETWVDEISGSLSSKEFGRDLRSAGNLMKKHQQMEEDILNHEERVNEILEQATAFEEADHFEKEEITERAADVAERLVRKSSVVSYLMTLVTRGKSFFLLHFLWGNVCECIHLMLMSQLKTNVVIVIHHQ